MKIAGSCALLIGALAVGTAQEPKKGPSAPSGVGAGTVARLGQTRLRHAQPATCVAFAVDGKTVFTGGEDGTVRAWSVETGAQTAVAERPGTAVRALALTAAGKRLVADFGDALRFYDPGTLGETAAHAHSAPARFALSADGRFVCSVDALGGAVVEEIETGLPQLFVEGARLCAFRPDGRALAVGGAGGEAVVYQLAGGKPLLRAAHEGTVTGVAFSPSGKRLAVAWRTKVGDAVARVYAGDDPKPAAEVPGAGALAGWVSETALACGGDAGAGVYDLARRAWVGRVPDATGPFAVSPDGTKLAALGSGLRVRLWDITSGKQLHSEDDTFPEPALLAGTADGRGMFLLAGEAAYHWDTGTTRARAAGALPGRAVAAAAAGGKLLVATPEALLLYDGFDRARPLPKVPTRTFPGRARVVALAATGARLAWATDAGKVLVSGTDGADRREVPLGTTSAVYALAFDPAGERLGVLGRDAHFRVWDVTAVVPKPLWKARVQRGQRGAVAFAPDGRTVAVGSTAQVLVFDAAAGPDPDEARPALYHLDRYSDAGHVHHLAFSPDGRALVLGSAGHCGRVEVWDVATRELVRTFSTGYGGIARLCVFPDGSRAASAGAEEAVTVWDLTYRAHKPAPSARELQVAWAELESPRAAVGVPAARRLAAGGDAAAEVIARGAKQMGEVRARIKARVADLGSSDFATREAASRELVAYGVRALPALAAAIESDDPEVRNRADYALKQLGARGFVVPAHGLAGDELRMVRAVQALEEIGTAAARRLLAEIGASGGRAGADAKAALARLKK